VIQNPQVFNLREIKAAYRQEYLPMFTDDAIVAEKHGLEINLVEGDQKNIKITHPADIEIGKGILEYNRLKVVNTIKDELMLI
jgi:2-C-methyl-D-erythritol 4-phosphate cytidylyltransferase